MLHASPFFVLSVHVVTASLLLLPVVEGGDVEQFEWLVMFVFHYLGVTLRCCPLMRSLIVITSQWVSLCYCVVSVA